MKMQMPKTKVYAIRNRQGAGVEDERGRRLFEWYDGSMSRTEAEYYLKRSTKDGSFLVRHGQDRDSFVISFRYVGICAEPVFAVSHVLDGCGVAITPCRRTL